MQHILSNPALYVEPLSAGGFIWFVRRKHSPINIYSGVEKTEQTALTLGNFHLRCVYNEDGLAPPHVEVSQYTLFGELAPCS